MTTPYGPGDHGPTYHVYDGDAQLENGLSFANNASHFPNYPPLHNELHPSYVPSNPAMKDLSGMPGREISRTPSPTPSEVVELSRKSVFDWRTLRNWRFWVRREWLWYYVLFFVILVVVALVAIYDKQIVHFLQPTATKIRDLPAGFLIPIGILFVLSFPPLFGHEIVAILCGLVWGLWIGFAIVAAGTYIGEVGNFYAFKYCCRARGEKLERTNILYACLSKIVREGGFKIALIARFSAIPGHFTTAIFSTCGMNIFVFSAAAILTLPKQFITVYVGVVLEQSGTTTTNTKNKIIEDSVLAVTIIITGIAMWYILRKVNEAKPDVIYARRKARQGKLERAGMGAYPYTHAQAADSDTVVAFNPTDSDSALPLNPGESTHHQRWDAAGHAVGVAGDPTLYAPAPRPAAGRTPTFRTEGGGGFSATGERYATPDGAAAGMRERGDARAPVRAPQRQESTDSVGWAGQNEGMGADAYSLPTLRTHTPLSGGVTPRAGAAGAAPLQQQQQQQQPALPFALQPGPASAQYAQFAGSGLSSPPFGAGAGAVPPAHALAPSEQSFYTHASEPSDASFYTAAHSRFGTEEPLVAPSQPPARAFSPAPPSYHTADLR